MAWPIESDYFEAVQNPQSCFKDQELKSGKVALTPLGLPKPITGAFASVYELTCGARKWAVRCFLREYADQQRRYEAISRHLATARVPFTVGFEYQREGIRVRGQWYPIVKMEWIDGESLVAFVERNLYKRNTLLQLARQWVQLINALRRTSISHGDLQHGNVLISKSVLRLIDYDGMFVPELSGLTSHEIGHRNFQHPRRTSADFNPQLDSFSAWVIFVSISGLAVDPTLWKIARAGDECLLFRREDFLNPGRSEIFRAFELSGRSELHTLASLLKTAIRSSPNAVPSLDNAPVGGFNSTAPRAELQQATSPLPDWLMSNVVHETNEVPRLPVPGTGSLDSRGVGAKWIIDHLIDSKPLPPLSLTDSVTLERCTLALAGGVVLSVSLFALLEGTVLATVGCIVTCCILLIAYALGLYCRFRSLAVHRNRRCADAAMHAARQSANQSQTVIAALVAEHELVTLPLAKLVAEYNDIPQLTRTQTSFIERERLESFSALAKMRADYSRGEANRTATLLESVGHKVSQLTQQLSDVERAEKAEIERRQTALRVPHVVRALKSARLLDAYLPGIGDQIKFRLMAAGVISAEDISAQRVANVSGIGPARSQTLRCWRERVRLEAEQSSPSLSNYEICQIRATFESNRGRLILEIESEKAREDSVRQAILNDRKLHLRKVEAEERRITEECDRKVAVVLAAAGKRRSEIEMRHQQLKGQVEATRQRLEARMREAERTLFTQQVELCRLERDFKRYKNVTYLAYVRGVFGIRPRSVKVST